MNPGAILVDMQSRPWENAVNNTLLPPPDADVKRFLEQGALEFITGKRELTKANWDAWVEEFKKVGGEEWNKKAVDYAKSNNLLH